MDNKFRRVVFFKIEDNEGNSEMRVTFGKCEHGNTLVSKYMRRHPELDDWHVVYPIHCQTVDFDKGIHTIDRLYLSSLHAQDLDDCPLYENVWHKFVSTMRRSMAVYFRDTLRARLQASQE